MTASCFLHRAFLGTDKCHCSLCGLPAHHASRVMDVPVSTSVSTADWTTLNRPLPRAQRLGKLFAFLGDPSSSGPSVLLSKAILANQPILQMSNREESKSLRRAENEFLSQMPLKSSLGQERSKSPYSLSKIKHMVK